MSHMLAFVLMRSCVYAVEMDEEEDAMSVPVPMSGIEGTEDGISGPSAAAVAHAHPHQHETPHAISQPYADVDPGSPSPSPSPPGSPHVFHPPAGAHPSALFSFPTPTAYAARVRGVWPTTGPALEDVLHAYHAARYAPGDPAAALRDLRAAVRRVRRPSRTA